MLDVPFQQQTLNTHGKYIENTEYEDQSDKSSLPDTEPFYISYDAAQVYWFQDHFLQMLAVFLLSECETCQPDVT